MSVRRSVESPHYHVWTDALHARHLARHARNDWDRGAYIRWTVNTTWTAFEMVCEEALGVADLGMRFKDRLTSAFQKNGVPAPDWSSGVWQKVLRIYGLRKDYVHGDLPQERLLAPLHEAEEAIVIGREAIKEVFHILGKTAPSWVDDDTNPEMPRGGMAHGTANRAGVDPSDPARVRIVYEFQGREYESELLPAGTDPERRWRPSCERPLFLSRPSVPTEAITT